MKLMRYAMCVICVAALVGTAFAGPRDSPGGAPRQVVKFGAQNSETFVFTDPFHLNSTVGLPFNHWAGCLLRVHVVDGSEISVIGGTIRNQGQGTQGIASLENLPPGSAQHHSSHFLATAWSTSGIPSASGRPLATSHSCPVVLTLHAKATCAGANSDVDLEVQVYDIFHVPMFQPGDPPIVLVPSDLVWAYSNHDPQPGHAFPSYPPDSDDPNAHWVHVDFTTTIPPGTGLTSHFWARETGKVDVGLDHTVSVDADTWGKIKERYRK